MVVIGIVISCREKRDIVEKKIHVQKNNMEIPFFIMCIIVDIASILYLVYWIYYSEIVHTPLLKAIKDAPSDDPCGYWMTILDTVGIGVQVFMVLVVIVHIFHNFILVNDESSLFVSIMAFFTSIFCLTIIAGTLIYIMLPLRNITEFWETCERNVRRGMYSKLSFIYIIASLIILLIMTTIATSTHRIYTTLQRRNQPRL